jgi:hypothetical protein
VDHSSQAEVGQSPRAPKRTAHDRAAQLKDEEVFEEIRCRLREAAADRGDFDRVHSCPSSPGDVSDEPEARLVLVDPEHPHIKDEWGSPAATQATAVLDSRGASPRRNRNALVFLAADKARLEALQSAARLFLAWHSMEKDREALNLDPFQLSQVKAKVKESDDTVRVRIPEAYVWVLVPEQERGADGKIDPQAKVVWQNERLQSGPEPLAVRACRKLKGAEWLFTSIGATRLRIELDRIPLWRGDQVTLRQLAEDFGRYLYLPRLRSTDVLRDAIEAGLNLFTWERETFAFAEGWDETAGRYRALRAGQVVRIDLESEGLVVRPEAAARQIRADETTREGGRGSGPGPPPLEPGEGEPGRRGPHGEPLPFPEPPVAVLRRFHGSVQLDPARVGRDAGRVAEEVIQHLAVLRGAAVKVSLEIQADAPDGVPDATIRTVTENCRTLRFETSGFEEE